VDVPAPLLVAPTILLLHQAITIGIAPVSAALTALTVCLIPRGVNSKAIDTDSALRQLPTAPK
jgi:hypothetical protein